MIILHMDIVSKYWYYHGCIYFNSIVDRLTVQTYNMKTEQNPAYETISQHPHTNTVYYETVW